MKKFLVAFLVAFLVVVGIGVQAQTVAPPAGTVRFENNHTKLVVGDRGGIVFLPQARGLCTQLSGTKDYWFVPATGFDFDSHTFLQPLSIAQGGTNAITVAAAAENLGVGLTDSPSYVGLTLTGLTEDGRVYSTSGVLSTEVIEKVHWRILTQNAGGIYTENSTSFLNAEGDGKIMFISGELAEGAKIVGYSLIGGAGASAGQETTVDASLRIFNAAAGGFSTGLVAGTAMVQVAVEEDTILDSTTTETTFDPYTVLLNKLHMIMVTTTATADATSDAYIAGAVVYIKY